MSVNSAQPEAPGNGFSIPVVQPANRVSVTIQPTDLTLSLGITRSAFNNEGVQVGSAVVYTGAYSLSPTTAKQLAEILRITVDKYEQEWGKIPMDQATLDRFSSLEKEPFIAKSTKAAAKKSAKTVRVKR